MFYDTMHNLFPYRWSPDLTLATVINDANYLVAWRYFLMDCGLVCMALIWGMGFCGLLMRQERGHKSSLPFSAFAVICIAAGFALMIAELFLLVLLHSLTPTTVLTLFSITGAAACYFIFLSRQDIRRCILPVRVIHTIVPLLLLLILATYQLSSACAWYLSDSTSYHVPYADFFLLNKGLSSIPEYLIYPYQSLNFNLLYSLGLMLDRDLSYLQTLHATFATLTLLGIYAFCISAGQRLFLAVGIPAALILSMKEIHINRFGANVDCGSMFFVLSTVFTLSLWVKNRSLWLLMLSAISFGIAMGTKYLMCIFALPIAICILLTEGRNWKPMVIYITCAAVWGLWWYLRNYIYTGNPVHPFAAKIFGLYLWNENDLEIQMQGLLEARIPRSITGFVLMPFYAFRDPILFSLGTAVLVSVLYLSTLFSWLLKSTQNFLLLFCWIYLVMWFYGAQDPRYLMPIIPLVFVYSGSVINAFFDRYVPITTNRFFSGAAAMAALIYLGIFVQQEFIRVSYSGIGSPPNVKEKTMRENNPSYDLISHTNEMLGAEATVYEFLLRDIRWFAKVHLVGNHFGPHGYYRMINASLKDNGQPGLSPEKMETVLREKYAAQAFITPPPPHLPYNTKEFDDYFIVLYRNEAGTLYKFKDHP